MAPRSNRRRGRDGHCGRDDRGRDRRDDRREARRSRSSRRRDRRRSPTTEPRKRRRRSPETEYSSSSGSASSSGSGAKKKSADSDKDEIVHFSWSKGQKMGDKKEYSRYQVQKLLGDGTFGRVLLCHDSKQDQEVAVKVIRDVRRYAENAKIEADILRDIKKADPHGKRTRSAIMFDTFLFNAHFCLVFEVCGCSLYDFLKENNFRGFWMQDIQHFAEQSLDALGFLHSRLQMTHTDLKPENILLAANAPPRRSDFPREAAWQEKNKNSKNGHTYFRPVSSDIKLIDFGNATYEDEHHSSIINTRQYRGPEVILSMGWNELSDVWSMGLEGSRSRSLLPTPHIVMIHAERCGISLKRIHNDTHHYYVAHPT
ncbi:unnamed protein product [Durusdinium trenchii]|uniref:Protein kinase domain-containing protein n=1 Tax=Durusdinium trenchii TaxID=1381693 RepID=A0ABP0QCV9_9DINO